MVTFVIILKCSHSLTLSNSYLDDMIFSCQRGMFYWSKTHCKKQLCSSSRVILHSSTLSSTLTFTSCIVMMIGKFYTHLHNFNLSNPFGCLCCFSETDTGCFQKWEIFAPAMFSLSLDVWNCPRSVQVFLLRKQNYIPTVNVHCRGKSNILLVL